MKKNVLIIVLLAVFLSSEAQTKSSGEGHVATIVPLNTPRLIADETWITNTKTGAKIVTYSTAVYDTLLTKFSSLLDSVFVQIKHQNKETYKEYRLSVSKQAGVTITNWAKLNL